MTLLGNYHFWHGIKDMLKYVVYLFCREDTDTGKVQVNVQKKSWFTLCAFYDLQLLMNWSWCSQVALHMGIEGIMMRWMQPLNTDHERSWRTRTCSCLWVFGLWKRLLILGHCLQLKNSIWCKAHSSIDSQSFNELSWFKKIPLWCHKALSPIPL